MPRIAAAAAAAAALAAALACCAPAPPAAAKEPLFVLTAKPEKEKVVLGEKIRLDLSLQSRAAKAASCGKLELGSPGGVAFYVRVDKGVSHQVSRLMGRYEGNTFKEAPAGREQLKPGKSLAGKVELLAVAPGEWEITATYAGVEKGACPDVLEAKPVVVKVGPGAGGETRLGVKIRTSKGEMTAELYPDRAFNTVHNFATLASNGFYDHLLFHRIVKDFMVQTGDPKGNGTGGPGYYLPAEFNDLKHEKGVLSMARENHPNTAGSQFFVMHAKTAALDGKYTGFGKVIQGTEVIDALAAVPTQRGGDGQMSDPLDKPKLDAVQVVLLKQAP